MTGKAAFPADAALDFDEAALEGARKFFCGPCDFVMGAADLASLPEASRPEIAIAGRSNVGKSSLVNALTGRKTLAKTSGTPGRTQQLNYFDMAGRLYMVDMPGYGYAKVSKELKKSWDELIFSYLRGRPNLRCVLVLVDARHGLKESDLHLMALLDKAAVSYRLILTKADKTKTSALKAVIETMRAQIKKHPAAFPEILATSAHDNYGIEALRALIHAYAASV